MENIFCHESLAERKNEPAKDASEASFAHSAYFGSGETRLQQTKYVNKIAKQMWPFVSACLAKIIKDAEPLIQKVIFLGSFKFLKIDLGSISPLLSEVKVHDQNPTSNEILIDASFSYAGDADVLVSVASIEGGVANFLISGTVQIGLKLVSNLPIISDISVALLEPPLLEYKLTDTLAALDFFGVDGAVFKLINEQIAKNIVLPNKIEQKIKLPRKFSSTPEIKGVLKVEAKLQGLEKYAGKHAAMTLKIGSHWIVSNDIVIGEDSAETAFIGRVVHESNNDNTLKVLVVIKEDDENAEKDKIIKANVDVSVIGKTVRVETSALASHGSVLLTVSLESLSSAKEDFKDLALLEVHLGTAKGLLRHRKPLLVKLSVGAKVMQFVASKASKIKRRLSFFVTHAEVLSQQVLTVKLMDLESDTALGQADYILSGLIGCGEHKEVLKLQGEVKNAELVMSLKLSAVT